MVCFDGVEDLREKVAYYLVHDEERMQIAENGYRKVKEHHGYVNRVREMLRIIEETEA